MWFQIFFSIACIAAAIGVTAFIVINNRELGGKAAPGWWVVSILISQIFIVAIMAVWWKDWWVSHQWLMNVSTGLTIAGVILWAVAKIYTRRHW
jgi:drug/metabolite transporter (DMT)-like permease